jgi:hypothetical protein
LQEKRHNWQQLAKVLRGCLCGVRNEIRRQVFRDRVIERQAASLLQQQDRGRGAELGHAGDVDRVSDVIALTSLANLQHLASGRVELRLHALPNGRRDVHQRVQREAQHAPRSSP